MSAIDVWKYDIGTCFAREPFIFSPHTVGFAANYNRSFGFEKVQTVHPGQVNDTLLKTI